MNKPMYPIQDGPSVPWEVMAPHESQCRKNHGQTLERIDQRGGLGCAEAYAVVNGMELGSHGVGGLTWFAAKNEWIKFAERINLHYAELERYKAALERIASFGEGPVVTTSFDEPGAAKIAREALNPPAH